MNDTQVNKAEDFVTKSAQILEMIATGEQTAIIYDAIGLMYEERHPGMRCSMLELDRNKLLHGGAPSLPKEYCEAIHGLENGPHIGSCGSSTFTGERVLVENIETDFRWETIKEVALPHGMRCCWSEPIKNATGKILGAFGMYYDYPALPNEQELEDLISAARLTGIVMERDHAQKRIRQLAYYDELTVLASRPHFYQYIESLLKSSKISKQQFSLLYIDLDNFKDINDNFGHGVGDSVLKEVALRIPRAGSEIDFIARLGGDEFIIVVKDVVDNEPIADLAQRCLDIIMAPMDLYGRKFRLSCSIGIAHYPNDGEDVVALLKASDIALYYAKEHGKHCYAFYSTELTEKAEFRFQFEHYLREAIDNNQLILSYQPQVNASSGKLVGVEALTRWQHPEIGTVSPEELTATAEKIGMINQLDEWVLKTACQQSVQWRKAGFPNLQIAVNISPLQFLDNNFVALVKNIIEESGVEPSSLMLEVTENASQTDLQNTSVIQNIKALGVSLALDDFGTGYSSFASLKHFKVDCLKIDKYFINDLLNDKETNLLVASMIEMGHKLGHYIIAEGVEELEQLKILQKMGCDSVQGYWFSKAVSPHEIEKFLDSHFEV